MFRSIGKSKIAVVLAIVFGISLFFFKGGSRYSNIFNSDNIVAKVSGTPISTTKFNRTLQINIDQFSNMIGKKITSKELKAFQIHSLALGALVNDAVFENEYDKKKFIIDETVIAKKTKERIPQLYDQNNKINEVILNQFLQQQNLKIEDIVQIINFELRDDLFTEAFFKSDFPNSFTNKINQYDNHSRRIQLIKIPMHVIKVDTTNELTSENMKIKLTDFLNNNSEKYMSKEKRDIEYILISKKNLLKNYYPSEFDIVDYYNNNKENFFENEKRSFIQFNFKNLKDANFFKDKINNFTDSSDIIKFAKKNNFNFNSFENLEKKDLLENISKVLFELKIGQQSEIIDTKISKNIIILQKIKKSFQKSLEDSKKEILYDLKEIQINEYYDSLKEDISTKIVQGATLEKISEFINIEKPKNIFELTQNFSIFDKSEKKFYDSIIANSFKANKDFVNDIIEVDNDFFYTYNVKNIIQSRTLNYDEIKTTLLKDWLREKKIEKINKLLEKNIKNFNFINDLANKFNLPTKELVVNLESDNIPNIFLQSIFKGKKGNNIKKIIETDIHIARINEVIIQENNNFNNETISLKNGLRNSFGNELIKKAKITTNDNLINAVVDRY